MLSIDNSPEPPHVKAAMKKWRLGLDRLPKSYIERHELLALQLLVRYVKSWGASIVTGSRRLVPAGDLDGMEVMRAILTTKSGKILRVQYRDAHNGGAFYVDTGRGHTRLTATDLL